MSFGAAFEIASDDVGIVLMSSVVRKDYRAGRSDAQLVSDLMDELDLDAATSAALDGDEMDEQTDMAHENLREQLVALGAIAGAPEQAEVTQATERQR